MKLYHIYISTILIALSLTALGQQDPQFSQQYVSRININPAATSISDYAEAYLIARQQWVGFEGAPSSQLFNAHGYIEDIRSSVGMSVVSDIVGRNRFLNLMFAYAYHVKTGEESSFAFGLSAGLAHRRFNGNIGTDMPEIDPDIIEMLQNGKSVYRPDVNFGITYTSPKFAFGFSATHLTHYLYKDNWFRFPLHGYAFMEAHLGGESIRFTPRIQVMSALGTNNSLDTLFFEKIDLLFDAGGVFSFNDDRFWIGASFRFGMPANPFTGTSVAAMVGINLTPNLRLGYSYDYKLGNTFQNVKTYGSHEIMLNYRMKIREKEASEATPRFFE